MREHEEPSSRSMRLLASLSLGAALAVGGGCQRPPTVVEQVLERGEIVVVTRPGATTYYLGPDGPAGMEQDLAQGFATFLGVDLRVVTTNGSGEMFDALAQGQAHLAAGVAVTEARQQLARFGPSYQEVTQQVVYRFGADRPRALDALNGGRLEVATASAHAERLAALQADYAELAWHEPSESAAEDLLARVWKRDLDYTVAHSHEVAIQQRYYPELRVAFDLDGAQSLAWAFPLGRDDSLHREATRYFDQIRESGQLARLLEKHYGHLREFDYVGTRVFMRHLEERLPDYRPLFEEAARANDLDWRLLAAMAYQESHWNPRAVSPTGVRGIMMLTQNTARELGLERRTDPRQSITGGARYLRHLWERMPDDIPEPDRKWMAVAAYNIGAGHVAGARYLTELRGGDPTSWVDVKDNLPLLQQRKWYQQTRYGYARGNEAFVYVENIRSYYDILKWTMDLEPHFVRGAGAQIAAAQ